ncbi:MAG TPA: FhaA domain-containing protein [Blastocatellia bacterium]|nr:FhaA domain-containing protein [Blastocatellia bacterium]
MSDSNDSVLDKAEGFARRVLERLGSKADSRTASEKQQIFSPREIGDLTSRIERVIESSLQEDKQGVKRVAPNHFKILFTYEETSRLNTQYIEALAAELKAIIFEYINNRRYETRGPVVVETGRDLFAKVTVIKPSFESTDPTQQPGVGTLPETVTQPARAAAHAEGARRVELRADDGRSFRVQLQAGAAPAYVGRVAGNAIRIDDPSISRMHCSIAVRTTGDIVVADLGSSNGTSLNGQPLSANEARPIKAGDTIKVGDVALTVGEIA